MLALAAAALIFGGMARPMLHGQIYVGDDLGAFHLPVRAFYARCLAAGEPFLWSPELFCGFYIHGEGQGGLFHPLHWLLYRALPLDTAFNLELLANYPFALAGTFLFLRRWSLPRDAAALGGLIFTSSGFLLNHYHHLNAVAVAAHVPWLLLSIDTVLRDDRPRRRARAQCAISVLTASQGLLGHPHSVWLSAVVESLYALFLVLVLRRSVWGLVAPGLAKVAGVLMAGIQWVPTWDVLSHSLRQRASLEYLAFGSLHPANLVQLLAPYLYRSRVFAPGLWVFGDPEGLDRFLKGPAESVTDWRAHEFGLYNGAIVPVLLLWLAIRWRALGSRRVLASGAGVLGALGLALSFGRYNLAFFAYARLPILNMFRVPARYLLLVHLATAILAAIALADLSELDRSRDRPSRRALRVLLGLPVAAALLALMARLLARIWPETLLRPCFGTIAETVLGIVLVSLATALVLLAARGYRQALIGLVAFVALDLALYGSSYLRATPPMTWAQYRGMMPPPPGPPGQRVKVFSPFSHNLWTVHGLRLVDGYVGLEPRRRLDYKRDASWHLTGATWFTAYPTLGWWVPVPEPLPWVRLVTRVVASAEPDRDLETIDSRTTALVERALPIPGGPPGEVIAAWERPGRIDVAARADSRQLLVVAETFHEGWRARVDGRAQPVLRVNGDFLGCILEPGRHRVRLRFEPPSLRLGSAATGLGVALSVLSLVITPRLRGTTRPVPPDRSFPRPLLGRPHVRSGSTGWALRKARASR